MDKMSLLSRFSWGFVKRYRITVLLWLTLLVFGIFSYTTTLKREGFPAINVPFSLVRGTYLVENPSQIDNEVIKPLAAAFEDIEEVNTYQATTTGSTFAIAVEFNDGATSKVGTGLLQDAIDSISLPESVEVSAGAIDASKFDSRYDLLFAIYDQMDTDYTYLQTLAEKAAVVAESKKGVQSATVKYTVEEFTDPASGQPTTRQTSVNRVGLRTENGFEYYPAISIGVIKDDSLDDIELFNVITSAIDEMSNNGIIDNANIEITADYATDITRQINSLQSNLIGGLIAVLIVAFLFISWRAALVIALFIPTVLATTLLGLSLVGFTLNTITLFALILTLGLFVDDATILVEAIDSHRQDKAGPKTIISKAVSRVGIASIAGTFTTVLVFTPMLFVSGILGEFIILLPLTVIISLLVSLIVSLVLIPFLSRPIVLSSSRNAIWDRLSLLVPVEKAISTFLSKLPLIAREGRLKAFAIYAIMIGLSVVSLLNAGYFFSKLRFQIFPQSKDSNRLIANVTFVPNTDISQVTQTTKNIDESIASTVGNSLEYVSYVTANQRMATIEIGLIPYQDRKQTSGDILTLLNENTDQLVSASATFTQLDAGPPEEEYPFQMRIYGEDIDTLKTVSADVSQAINGRAVASLEGDSITVSEVKIDGLETILRSERGRFVLLKSKYSQADSTSAAVAATQSYVEDTFLSPKEDKTNYLKVNNLPDDTFDFDVSQESDNAESFSSIGTGIIIALALMYGLLVLLYDSFSQPLLIFLAIPFSFFGVAFGLWATDSALSFFVMIGFLGLIGIVVNNSILLVQYANQERASGADRYDAISRALKDRFRPLITTTCTTIFALLPLALSDPFWQPLAYTLIFGMASSATLIVLSFPYYYLLLERLRDAKNRKAPWLI